MWWACKTVRCKGSLWSYKIRSLCGELVKPHGVKVHYDTEKITSWCGDLVKLYGLYSRRYSGNLNWGWIVDVGVVTSSHYKSCYLCWLLDIVSSLFTNHSHNRSTAKEFNLSTESHLNFKKPNSPLPLGLLSWITQGN